MYDLSIYVTASLRDLYGLILMEMDSYSRRRTPRVVKYTLRLPNKSQRKVCRKKAILCKPLANGIHCLNQHHL